MGNSKIKITKKPKTNININKDTSFIKIYPAEGGITNQPKCDVRSLDVVQGNTVSEKGKQLIRWYIQFNLINGDIILDRTPYKTMDKAEQVMDKITRTLPNPKPITTIQQPVAINQGGDYMEVGSQEPFPIGFRADSCEEGE